MKLSRSTSSPTQAVTNPKRRRVTRLLAALAVAVVLLVVFAMQNPGGLQLGIASLEQRWGDSLYSLDRSTAEKISILVGSYLRELNDEVPEVPDLVIDIPFKEMQKIYAKRDEALKVGRLVQGEDDFVKGEIRIDNRTLKVKMRLKGDWNDHLAGIKWSFRIHVRDGEQLFGMRRFSIQSPATRGYQSELMFFKALSLFGIMSPRYSFVNVTINGESVGLMAVEEFFSKELLEYNRRREGVIIRFDESLVWAANDSVMENTAGWAGAFDHYSNSAIDAFGSGAIEESESLSRQYKVAVGLMRGFINNQLAPSTVFDAQQMGRYLAVSDVFGVWHSIAWHNLRFYLNPVTLRFEPIAFDANLQDRMEENSIINDEPMLLKILDDPNVLMVYQQTLEELAELIYSGELEAVLREAEAQHLPILQSEFRLLPEFPLDFLPERLEKLRERFGRSSPTLGTEFFHASQFDAEEKTLYPALLHVALVNHNDAELLEITNAIPRDVQVINITWVNNDTQQTLPLPDIRFPFLIPARGYEAPGQHWLFATGVQPEGSWRLEVTARLVNRNWAQPIVAGRTYVPLTVPPIPVSTLAEQMAAHPFLQLDEANGRLVIPAGRQVVNSSIIVPVGYGLVAEEGAQLAFASQAILLVQGPLTINGTQDKPVIFESQDGQGWPGLVVMHANRPSQVNSLIVKDTTSVAVGGWVLTGGVNFYASDVALVNCQLHDSHGEDALNIIHSEFNIRNLLIQGTASDAFDSDFSTGTVVGSRFVAIGKAGGGDAIDVSGSQINVLDSEFTDVSDKALSVGERSQMTARNIRMSKVGTGAAAKDASSLSLVDSTIDGASFAGLTAYIKKPEYGPATIEAENVTISNAETPVLVQTDSVVSLNGTAIDTTDVDVDVLYDTIMQKGLQ